MPTKQGNGGVPAGEHLVNADAAQVFAALVRADNGLIAYLIDEVEAHMRDGSGAVEAALGLHLPDDVLERFFLVFVKVELFPESADHPQRALPPQNGQGDLRAQRDPRSGA